VTAYALLLGLVGAILTLAASMSLVNTQKTWEDLGAAALVSLAAALCFLLARGLWELENWARTSAIVLHTLVALGTLFSMYQALTAPGDTYGGQVVTAQTICVSGIPLLIGAGIAFWFLSNGKYFVPD
jgi:multisubunit Na+/H+ antiporter MnhG subunit